MKQVLIVDDSSTVRKVVGRIFASLGFTTREAENGLEALRSCRAMMPAVILLDWNMPVMDGITFLEQLRKLEDGRHPKVIFCTTENDTPQIARAIETGADEYIMKPFDRDILMSKLEEVGLLAC